MPSLSDLTRAATDAIARADAATAGPWTHHRLAWQQTWCVDERGIEILRASYERDADMAFAAAARTDVPALARAVLALAAVVEQATYACEECAKDGRRTIATYVLHDRTYGGPSRYYCDRVDHRRARGEAEEAPWAAAVRAPGAAGGGGGPTK